MALGISNNNQDKQSYAEYIQDLQKQINEAFEIANKKADQSRQNKSTFMIKKARTTKLLVGDRMLVKILVFDGNINCQINGQMKFML